MMRFIGWCCRMMAWLIFWPIGLVLSARRGSRKRHQETMQALRQPGPRPLR